MSDLSVNVGQGAVAVSSGQKKLEKARLIVAGGPTIVFRFNPTRYTVAKSASWEAHKALDAKNSGRTEWQGTQPRRLNLHIVLDASDTSDGSVLNVTEQLFSCCEPVKRQGNEPSAPVVTFSWGNAPPFRAVMTSVTVNYTMFRMNGAPFRAEADLALQQVAEPPKGTNPTSTAPTPTRFHPFHEGDSLASIAYQEYGDPAFWRVVAEANSVDDPLGIPLGKVLALPEVREARKTLAAWRARPR